jgi:acetyl coenzyme A synthetase (ADP forming)-like protein
MTNDLRPFFSPRGIALIGASANPKKIGHGVLRNLTQYSCQGHIYPVNPHYQQLIGWPCYPDIASVPEPVELAVIVLPAELTPAILKACGEQGVKAAVIISGGFKEVGPVGATLEDNCVTIARHYGMRLIGPNCVGTIDPNTGLNTTFIAGMPKPGRIGFLSQSGGVCGGIIDYIIGQYIGFSCFVSLGNEADVTETDVIEYLGQDPQTHVIAVYVEGITDGIHFMEVARQVTRYKPIVLLRAGRTEAGGKAVSSHTGAIAGSNAAYQAVFHQCGIIEAHSIRELFDISLALASQPLPSGNRVFVLSNSGGPAALAADCLSTQDICLPELAPHTKATLREGLDPVIKIANPTDMLGGAGPREYEFALPVVLADPGIDAVLVILVPHLLLDPTEAALKICRVAKYATKPVLTCFVGDHTVDKARQILHEQHLPMYSFPETTSRALSAMVQYATWRDHQTGETPPKLKVNRLAVRQLLIKEKPAQILGEASTRPLLTAYEIPVIPGSVAHSLEEATDIANELGYPVVLKIVSPDILHKSEAGGIILNLKDVAAVTAAYRQLMQNAASANPDARREGVLVEAMAPQGYEVIVGIRRDPQFGPLIMFGLGGIYVELFRDVSFRVAPISRGEALAMIQETKAGRLLSGLRGQETADINALADCILHLSQLALDFPEIEEAEINPLLVLARGKGAMALDGRILLSSN